MTAKIYLPHMPSRNELPGRKMGTREECTDAGQRVLPTSKFWLRDLLS